jgi:hypothetical protein
MSPRYIERPSADLADADPSIVLPYGLTHTAVVRAVNDIYHYLHAINRASIDHGYERLDDFMQKAAFSGLLSDLAVRSMAHETEVEGASPGLRANLYHNGRPDLVPRGAYPGDAILHGDEGIEVKASRALSGWQGHNIEAGYLMVVQFKPDLETQPVYDREPTTITRVMVAYLEEEDWSFSGRSEGSRRTATASVKPSGYAKLVAGAVYVRGRAEGAPAPLPSTAGAPEPPEPESPDVEPAG